SRGSGQPRIRQADRRTVSAPNERNIEGRYRTSWSVQMSITTKHATLAVKLVVYGSLVLTGVGLGAGTAAATPATAGGAANPGVTTSSQTDGQQRLQRVMDPQGQKQQAVTNVIKKSAATGDDITHHMKP